MKKIMLLVLSLGMHMITNGQATLMEGPNELQPANLILSYVVNFGQPDMVKDTDSICNNGCFDSFHFLNNHFPAYIIENAGNGTIPVYKINENSPYYPYNILDDRIKVSPFMAKRMLGEVRDTYRTVTDEKLIVDIDIDPAEINGLEFIEDWNFDRSKYEFSKKVIGVCPIRMRQERYSQKLSRYKTFYFLDTVPSGRNKSESVGKLFAMVQYEFSIDPDYCKEMGFEYSDVCMAYPYGLQVWNRSNALAFLGSICDDVLEGRKFAIDYASHRKLAIDELKSNLGIKTEKVSVMLETGVEETTVLEKGINPDHFKSLIFCEEWYINEFSGQITKKVVGIAPVLFSESDTPGRYRYKKTVPFLLPLNEDVGNK
jgi:hypothetical protein